MPSLSVGQKARWSWSASGWGENSLENYSTTPAYSHSIEIALCALPSGRDSVWSDICSQTFRRKVLTPTSDSNSKPCKQRGVGELPDYKMPSPGCQFCTVTAQNLTSNMNKYSCAISRHVNDRNSWNGHNEIQKTSAKYSIIYYYCAMHLNNPPQREILNESYCSREPIPNQKVPTFRSGLSWKLTPAIFRTNFWKGGEWPNSLVWCLERANQSKQ
jgi:hypothetical protein